MPALTAPKRKADAARLAERLAHLRDVVRASATDRPGVYRMIGDGGEVVYVGKSKRLRTRLLSYFRAEFPKDKGARIVREAATIEWSYVPSEFAALLEELRLIKRLRPRFNVAMKRDARHYAFVRVAGGVAPRLTVVRGSGAGERGGVFYGPFVGAERVGDALRELGDALGLRDCTFDSRMRFSDQPDLLVLPPRTPGCIRHEIGTCLGPCVAAVRAEVYDDRVRQARAFLEGRDDEPMERLREAMQLASDEMAYERAAVLRDKLQRLEALHEQFARLRFAVESLSFAYIVPGYEGEDRFYLVRRGVVRAELPSPRTPDEWEGLRLECGRIFGTEGARTPRAVSTVPAHEVDELLLVSSWFSVRPAELQATVSADAVGTLWAQDDR
ncbi:MAG: UvrB/UvrC motif-containing protein [Gemmatimonadetes bacterium]|nr:UvrB/UvrC motif-containing protein [Gemmatimonadota bacterium]